MIFKNKSTYDFVVAGLGNPGDEYKATKHNVGFMVIDKFAENNNANFKKSRFNALVADCKIGEKRVLLLKPLTYMNLSGEAISKALNFYKISPENLVVICDDINLDAGKIRIRKKGSDGGQNGLKNIILNLKTQEFKRVRIGIGAKPHPEYDLKDWVLSNFSKEAKPQIERAINLGSDAIEAIIKKDADFAMSHFNGA